MNDWVVGRGFTQNSYSVAWWGWEVGSINFLIDCRVIHKLSTFSLETSYIGWLQ